MAKYETNTIAGEFWKVIPNSQPLCQVSDHGRVHTAKGILRGRLNGDGYRQVDIPYGKAGYQSFMVHRLVAMAFLPTPVEGMQVDHINNVRDDNRLVNLQWTTPSQNTLFQSMRDGTRGKLTPQDLPRIPCLTPLKTPREDETYDPHPKSLH